MPFDSLYNWTADVEIDFDLLNKSGGKIISYNSLSSDSVVNQTELLIMGQTFTAATARIFKISWGGQVSVSNVAGILKGHIKAANPMNPSPTTFVTAFTFRPYTSNTADILAGDRHGHCFYAGTLPGSYTFQLTAVNLEAPAGHDCSVLSGYQFWIEDCGRYF